MLVVLPADDPDGLEAQVAALLGAAGSLSAHAMAEADEALAPKVSRHRKRGLLWEGCIGNSSAAVHVSGGCLMLQHVTRFVCLAAHGVSGGMQGARG